MSCRTSKASSAALTLARAGTNLTDAQGVSVFHNLKTRVISEGKRSGEYPQDPSPQEYEDWINQQVWRARTRLDLTESERLSIIKRYEEARDQQPLNGVTFAAVRSLTDEMAAAESLYKREFQYVAGSRSVSVAEAEDFVTRARAEWEATPINERKSAPEEWVEVYRKRVHSRRRTSPPTDRATMYAMWRAETDPDAFPASRPPEKGYVVFDLETTGFDPEQHEIIEVGAIFLRSDGTEEFRESVLFSPTPSADGVVSTGAQDVHHITPDMLADRPHFNEQAAHFSSLFEGRTLVGHNVEFDYAFMRSHLERAGASSLPDAPLLDTLRQARFANLPTRNSKLSTVAEHFNIPYTEGHRAEHDADVCRLVMRKLSDQRHAA